MQERSDRGALLESRARPPNLAARRIRAAGAVTDQTELVVIGSQAILGQYPDAPERLLGSHEAGICFPGRANLVEMVEGATGELSRFEETFGSYAGSASDRTATLPARWRGRPSLADRSPDWYGIVADVASSGSGSSGRLVSRSSRDRVRTAPRSSRSGCTAHCRRKRHVLLRPSGDFVESEALHNGELHAQRVALIVGLDGGDERGLARCPRPRLPPLRSPPR